MKIENNPIKPATGASVSESRGRASGKTESSTPAGSSDSVRLSGLSAQLQPSGDMPVFDAARVSQIKQAIADGNFQINAGAIADRLISSAKELVDSQRRG